VTAPTYVGAGTAAQSTSTSNLSSGTPTLPTGWAQNDILILWIETRSSSLTLPGGWTAVPSAVPTYPTFGTTSRFYWKRAGSSESNPNVTSSGSDMYILQVYAFRGCISTGTPVENLAYTAVESATTSIVFPAVTTSGGDELLMLHVSGSSGSTVGAVTNGNLTGITERIDVDSSNTFDHWAVITGAKATAGSTGTSTCSWSGAETFIAVTIALKSNSLQTVTGSDVASAAADTASVSATIVAADTASGADTAVQTSSVGVTDAGTAVDSAGIRFGSADTGSFDESTKVVANGAILAFGTDAGSAIESASVRIVDTDSASTTDVAYVGYQGAYPPGPRVIRIQANH
jgi:hypothetical protein